MKPCTFLERPAAVRNAYKGFHDYSDDEEDEDKLLDTLLEETKDQKSVQVEEEGKEATSGDS